MQSLLPLLRCAQICGLTSQEMIVGARPRPEHELLAARYFRSSSVGKATMRTALVAAIRAALKASQTRSAAELLVALRMMLRERSGRSGAAVHDDDRLLDLVVVRVERVIAIDRHLPPRHKG